MNPVSSDAIKKIVPRCVTCFLISIPFLAKKFDPWLQLLLASIVVIVGIWPLFKKGLQSLNRFTFIALSLGIAYVYSFLALLWGDTSSLYFKPMVFITACIFLWLHIEQKLVTALLKPLQQFFDGIPKKASKMSVDGHAEVVAVDLLAKGDFVQVKPGEIIPVDGMIFSDNAMIDESILSEGGEPQRKGFGDIAISGWKNLKSPCIIQAQQTGSESTLAGMKLSASVALSRSLEGGGTVCIVLVGLFTLFGFLFWASMDTLTVAVKVMCTTFIVTSVSAFELARSLVIMRAIGVGVRKGIVFTKNKKFEKLYRVDTRTDDKGSTIKEFNRSVSSIIHQNLFLAVLYNVIFVPMALFGSITFVWAAVAMMIASCCIVINSFRLQ